MSVLDRFGGRVAVHIFGKVPPGKVIAVAGVERTVFCLEDAGVMVAAGFSPYGSVARVKGLRADPTRSA
jgi:hypothetical protein